MREKLQASRYKLQAESITLMTEARLQLEPRSLKLHNSPLRFPDIFADICKRLSLSVSL
jgi:hypothetical protein